MNLIKNRWFINVVTVIYFAVMVVVSYSVFSGYNPGEVWEVNVIHLDYAFLAGLVTTVLLAAGVAHRLPHILQSTTLIVSIVALLMSFLWTGIVAMLTFFVGAWLLAFWKVAISEPMVTE